MGQNNQESRRNYWATRLSVCLFARTTYLFARTAHSIACTAHSIARTAHSIARTAHSIAHTAHSIARTAHSIARTAHSFVRSLTDSLPSLWECHRLHAPSIGCSETQCATTAFTATAATAVPQWFFLSRIRQEIFENGHRPNISRLCLFRND